MLPVFCYPRSFLPDVLIIPKNFGVVKRERSVFFGFRLTASLTLDLYIVAHLVEAVKHVVSVFFK